MDKVQDSLGKLQELILNVKQEYIGWIVKNPTRASDTESSIKLLSYLLHGRLKKSSTILPELVYCGANLLAFWHDRIIQQDVEKKRQELSRRENAHAGLGVDDGPFRSAAFQAAQRETRDAQIQKIRSTLTIIDYLEVFLEVSARQMWGDIGRWVMIILIQSVKTGLRAALLLHYKVGLVGSTTLYHRRYNRRISAQQHGLASNITFVLKHSGRTVRKIHSAPALRARDWSVPSLPDAAPAPQELSTIRKVGEVIHLLRPLTHLACMGVLGTKSWGPWLVSMGMDLASLRIHSKTVGLRKEEKVELTRRAYSLCFYLMRSPFYDTCTKRRLLSTLILFSEKIPLLGNICGVLAQAIPEWQSTYSYMWTDY